MRAYTRTTPCFIVPEKKRFNIERFVDRYQPTPAQKPSLYTYIDPFISLLPEECVTGKYKRRWKASKRELASDHPDAAELYGESDEEEAEEGSQQGEDEDLLEGDDDGVMEDEVEYEVFSDDDAGDDDDGGYDGTRCPFFLPFDSDTFSFDTTWTLESAIFRFFRSDLVLFDFKSAF